MEKVYQIWVQNPETQKYESEKTEAYTTLSGCVAEILNRGYKKPSNIYGTYCSAILPNIKIQSIQLIA